MDVIVFVILAVVLVLGIGIPAMRSRINAARKEQCKNNLKQWGLALQNYHDSHKCFPPYAGGMLENGERLSGAVMLLPFLGMDPLWKQIAATPGQGGDPMHLALSPKPTGEFSLFLCPSSSVPFPVDGQQHLSYAFCVGDQINFGGGVDAFPNQELTSGAFGWRRGRNIAEFRDGISSTILMAERDLSDPREPRELLGRVAAVAAPTPADCLAMPLKEKYLSTTPVFTELMGERWSSGHPFYAVFVTAVPPNGPSCAASAPPSGKSVGGWFTASSRHTGGCHVLTGDGMVRFVSENINTGDLSLTQHRDGPIPDTTCSSYGVWGILGRIDDYEKIGFHDE